MQNIFVIDPDVWKKEWNSCAQGLVGWNNVPSPTMHYYNWNAKRSGLKSVSKISMQ